MFLDHIFLTARYLYKLHMIELERTKKEKCGCLLAVSTSSGLSLYIIGIQHYPLGSGKHHRTFLISGAKVRSFKKSCNT